MSSSFPTAVPTNRKPSLGGRTPLQAANIPAMDALAAAGVVGRANHVPASLPAGSDVANLSLLGYDPLRAFHRPGAVGGRGPIDPAGAERLRHPLQPGDDRRPADARLHGRAHLDRRSPQLAGHRGRAPVGRRPLGIHSRRQLSQSADLSRRRGAAAVHRRHPGHAAARSDRSNRCWRIIRAGRAATCSIN